MEKQLIDFCYIHGIEYKRKYIGEDDLWMFSFRIIGVGLFNKCIDAFMFKEDPDIYSRIIEDVCEYFNIKY